MIIYLKYEISIHGIEIEDEENKKLFEEALLTAIMKLVNPKYNSDIEIELIEWAGKI